MHRECINHVTTDVNALFSSTVVVAITETGDELEAPTVASVASELYLSNISN